MLSSRVRYITYSDRFGHLQKCSVTLVNPVGTSKNPVPSLHSVEETYAKQEIRMLMTLVTMEIQGVIYTRL